MITSRLCGGLGNQMFQYAVGRRLALRHGTSLALDITAYQQRYRRETPRPFELKLFNVEAALIDRLPGRLALARALRSFAPRFTGITLHQERSDAFDSQVRELPEDSYLIGYWQSYRYFEDVAPQLFRDFCPTQALAERSEAIAELMLRSVSVALHVRRGDYVTLQSAAKFHGVLGDDYYARAVARIRACLDSPIFFVFSDDIAWCRENLGLDVRSTHFIDWNTGAAAWQDLILMSHCKHHVIANSSFSWWAAWLADQRHAGTRREVIGPQAWFAKKTVSLADRFPRHWTAL